MKHAATIPILLALALSACSGTGQQDSDAGDMPTSEPQAQSEPAPSPSGPPMAAAGIPAPEPVVDDCGVRKLNKFLNVPLTEDVFDQIRKTVGHGHIRTIHPGDAVTMDYLGDRLNIEVGSDGKIDYFRCG